ncbi:MAG: hypothetical protein JSW68_06655 [Burkholderiales bacterium]|nr:MAG: hypothetical protein JSW68_06655 [Burkholderiales bacterium]
MKATRTILAASILALTAFGAQAAISDRPELDERYIASVVLDGAYVAGVIEDGLNVAGVADDGAYVAGVIEDGTHVASTDRSTMYIA